MTTKRELEARYRYFTELQELGLTYEECETLRRASMTLQSWGEMECNNDVYRAGEGGAVWIREQTYNGITKPRRIPDRETPAIKRCEALCRAHGLIFFHQGDPRGVAVYVGRQEALGGLPVEEGYNRLVAVF